LAEGIAEGKAEGRAEGKAEGLAEGKAEGRMEGLLGVARKLKVRGLSLQDIADDTGLSLKEIEAL
jgi:predicted transposase YdaD